MNRQHVLLLENDGALQGVLCDLFAYEDLDVTVCNSLAELQAASSAFPLAAIVSDSWAMGDYAALSPKHRSEIVELAKTAEVVLTTGQRWARQMLDGELGTVAIVEKPYDMDRLMDAVRVALERSSIRHSQRRDESGGQDALAACSGVSASSMSMTGMPSRMG